METLEKIKLITAREFRPLADGQVRALEEFLESYGYAGDNELRPWFRRMLQSILNRTNEFLKFDFDSPRDSDISSLLQELADHYGWIVDDYGEGAWLEFPRGRISVFISRETSHDGRACESYRVDVDEPSEFDDSRNWERTFIRIEHTMEAGVIISKHEPLWRFEPQTLMAQIKQRWPAVSFKPATRTSACSWWIRLPESEGKTLSGFLGPSRFVVAFEGYDEDCLEFALWLRRVVPETVKLVFTDNQHDVLPLTTATTADDLRKYVVALN